MRKGMKKLTASVLAVMLAAVMALSAGGNYAAAEEPEGQTWTLGLDENVNGPEDGKQGTNGWYFLYTNQIDVGEQGNYDVSAFKECTWATKGSMELASEGGSYEAMWMPEEYLADGLTGSALHQPDWDNPTGTFNRWVMTSNGTLNTFVETTAVTGIYAWEAPEDGDYKYDLSYMAGGDHCVLDGTTYYYINDYYIQDSTEFKHTPKQREGGVAIAVVENDTRAYYAEHAAKTPEHDVLFPGSTSGKVTMKKGDRLYFIVDPREVGSYDMADLDITITTGEDCVWGDVHYDWNEENFCSAVQDCAVHQGHVRKVTVQGELVDTTQPATCTEAGLGTYSAKFEDSAYEDQTAERPIPALGHDTSTFWDNAWSGDDTLVQYRWSTDYSNCEWFTACARCKEMVKMQDAESITMVSEEDDPSDLCTKGGQYHYHASFYWGWVAADSETLTADTGMGHDYSNIYNAEYDWTTDLSMCTKTVKCSRCNEPGEPVTENAQIQNPTCTEAGSATASFDWGWDVQTKEIPALGHTWGAWTQEAGTSKWTRTCSACGQSESVIREKPVVKLGATAYVYDGKAKKPAVTAVTVGGKKLKTDCYDVAYAAGRKNVGTYKVTVTLKNGYEGKADVSFTINPAGTSLKKVKKGVKRFTATWAKKTAQVDGYELQYSTSSKFKAAKTKTVAGAKKAKLVVKKVKGGKKYFVRIRTFKKAGGKKLYSAWSKAKTVKVKKK